MLKDQPGRAVVPALALWIPQRNEDRFLGFVVRLLRPATFPQVEMPFAHWEEGVLRLVHKREFVRENRLPRFAR